MKIKELVKLQKLLFEYSQDIPFNSTLISPLAFVITSVKQELDKKHKEMIENRWGKINGI